MWTFPPEHEILQQTQSQFQLSPPMQKAIKESPLLQEAINKHGFAEIKIRDNKLTITNQSITSSFGGLFAWLLIEFENSGVDRAADFMDKRFLISSEVLMKQCIHELERGLKMTWFEIFYLPTYPQLSKFLKTENGKKTIAKTFITEIERKGTWRGFVALMGYHNYFFHNLPELIELQL